MTRAEFDWKDPRHRGGFSAGHQMGNWYRAALGKSLEEGESRARDSLLVTRGLHVCHDVPNRLGSLVLEP